MWWATTSCSSRAIRLRSSSRVRRARSSAVSVVCSTSALLASRRPRRAAPSTTTTVNRIAASTPVGWKSAAPSTPSTRYVSSSVNASASTATRAGTRRASSSSTARCAMSPPTLHGQVKPCAPPASSCRRTSRAQTTMAAVDSHHAGTGRHNASTTAEPSARPIAKAMLPPTPPLSCSSARPPNVTPKATRHSRPCGSQRSQTDGGSGSGRIVHRSSRRTRDQRSSAPTTTRRIPVSVTPTTLGTTHLLRCCRCRTTVDPDHS